MYQIEFSHIAYQGGWVARIAAHRRVQNQNQKSDKNKTYYIHIEYEPQVDGLPDNKLSQASLI